MDFRTLYGYPYSYITEQNNRVQVFLCAYDNITNSEFAVFLPTLKSLYLAPLKIILGTFHVDIYSCPNNYLFTTTELLPLEHRGAHHIHTTHVTTPH